ncbi:MAG TPA: hypothetical protein VH593_04415, partial [Ktedonobacteraceae bacterium]
MNRRFENQLPGASPPMRLQPNEGEPVSPLLQNSRNDSITRRAGLVGWWLNLTAPRWPDHAIPVKERERLRKAELTSLSILAIFAFLIALVSNSLA